MVYTEIIMSRNKQKRQQQKTVVIIAVTLIVILVGLWLVPAPAVEGVSTFSLPTSIATPVVWPKDQQGAIGISGYGVLATNGDQTNAPIASIGKLMLALAVLKEKPLAVGATGPSITVTQQDVDLYASYWKQNNSVLPVQLGEQLTEYQMLQGLLIPSGDNVAHMLAVWVFGSVDNYLTYANTMSTTLGLKNTHFADASGLSPDTTSSAEDLVTIGQAVMQNPVLAEIIAQKSDPFPVVGTIRNYNTLLGHDDIVGIKTGNTSEAGGCFLLAATKTIDGQPFTIINAVMGAKTRNQALTDSKTLLTTNPPKLVTIVTAGQIVGSYHTPWGDTVNVVASSNEKIPTIGDAPISAVVHLDTIKGVKKHGDTIGNVAVTYGTKQLEVPLTIDNTLHAPSLWWKLMHL
jgi:serine-type D-Ala-D-Ala carboxypeptidase (penicillin-binding protein 5/6)